MIKCPRCKLPQAGIFKCQYCGYDLNKYSKKPTTIIRKRLKDVVGGFGKGQIVSSDKKSKVRSMKNTGKAKKSTDHFGSRSGTDRRKQKYAIDFPERRSGMDRRKWFGLRSSIARKREFESRVRIYHQESYAIKHRGTLSKAMRSGLDQWLMVDVDLSALIEKLYGTTPAHWIWGSPSSCLFHNDL